MANPRPSSSVKKHDSSITPQRKHRKLLKDGSGTEVWPESIEKIFVQGLREYWDSPYATYSQSRGRSRWRNQFLVDYLNKQGIERSKKQVASHIQVLRNMWKGEPEFHLVAGGDELYPESDSPVTLPVKLEEQYDSNTLIPFEWEDRDSNSVSPNFSPADSQSEFPPTPEHRPNLYPSDFAKLQHTNPIDLTYPVPGINSPSISPNGDYIHQLPPFNDPFGLPYNGSSSRNPKYTSPALSIQVPPAPYTAPSINRSSSGAQQQHLNRQMSVTPTHCSPAVRPTNKVTSIHLQADGMTPFSVKVDALATPSASQALQPPFSLRIRLCVPTTHDGRAPPTMHGFLSGVSLESLWSGSSRCITKTYANGALLGAEQACLTVANISVGTVNAALPESALNKCRWLDAALAVVLTQEIIVDDETLLFVIYELDRKSGGPMPSATLLGYQKYRPDTKQWTGSTNSTGINPNYTTAAASSHSNNSSLGSSHHMLSPSPVSPFSSSGTHAAQYARPGHQQLQYAMSPQALAAMRRTF